MQGSKHFKLGAFLGPHAHSARPSMESLKRKRISDVKAGVLMIDQVKPAVLEGTAVRV